MNNMAAVARPSPSDARIPCPACGGLIHPVAGKCKHCKHDLAAERSVRPSAAAALPALARTVTPVPAPAPPALPYQAATIIAPSPAALPPASSPLGIDREDSRPILPPRQTGGHRAVESSGWLGRNWPIVVIVLASLAIIGAVVLMMLPPSSETGRSGSKGGAAPGPAPDRMETNPIPRSSIDPTPAPSTPPGADPWATPRPTPPAPVPDPAPVDPFAGGVPGGTVDPNDPLSGNPFATGSDTTDALVIAFVGKLCERAKACTSNLAIQTACAAVAQTPRSSLPTNCPAAQRCIDSLDKVDLCGSSADPTSLVFSVSECVSAVASC